MACSLNVSGSACSGAACCCHLLLRPRALWMSPARLVVAPPAAATCCCGLALSECLRLGLWWRRLLLPPAAAASRSLNVSGSACVVAQRRGTARQSAKHAHASPSTMHKDGTPPPISNRRPSLRHVGPLPPLPHAVCSSL